AAVRTGLLSLLMAGGAADNALAFQLAESALAEAITAPLPAAAMLFCDDGPSWQGPFSLAGFAGSYRTRWCLRAGAGARPGDSYGSQRNYELTVEASVGRGARVRVVQGIAERLAE